MSLLGTVFKFNERTEEANSVTVIIPGKDIGRNIRFEAHFDQGIKKTPWVRGENGSRSYDHRDKMGCRVCVDYNEDTDAYVYTFSDFKDGRIPDTVHRAINLEKEF